MTASTDPIFDALVGGKKIELKGPYLLRKTLEPLPNVDVAHEAAIITTKVQQNTAPDLFVVDTLGLTDEQAQQLATLVVAPAGKTLFLR